MTKVWTGAHGWVSPTLQTEWAYRQVFTCTAERAAALDP